MQRGSIIAGKYRLQRPLEQGGMASVWVAENIALGVEVAIKIPLTELVPHAVQRMLREAQLSAQIAHPNIVRVFDFGITRQREPFIVMELLRGETLEDLLNREGKLDPVEAVRLLLPIADALSCAHERGIVHRDLKPANVFLARDSKDRITPKLLDFGIAKLDRLDVNGVQSHRRLTRGGTAVGSPDYMSPEQAEGLDDIDHRTDIWSLCVLVYELVSGSVPFADVPANGDQLLRAIIERPVTSFVCPCPGAEELWKVIGRGLVPREQRISTIRDLGIELARWLLEQGVDEDIGSNSVRTSWLGMSPRTASQSSRMKAVRIAASRLRSRRNLRRLAVAAALGLGAIGLDASAGLSTSQASALEHALDKGAAVVASSVHESKTRVSAGLLTPPAPAKSEPIMMSQVEPPAAHPPTAERRPVIDIWTRAKRAAGRSTRQ